MFTNVLILSIIFIALSIAGLAVRILVKSYGQFPDTHVSSNKEMQKRGITCAQKVDTGCGPGGFSGCELCGRKDQ